MAVFSEEPSDSEEEGFASDMDIREEVEAKKKKKKVDCTSIDCFRLS